jgi:ABC-2 type transport system ATP-binding protein
MTGQECIEYLAELQPPKRPGYVTALTRAFRAELNKPIEQLSKGNRQKIGIIQAFMHEPEILILDEPTSGLDPLMQEAFYSLIREAKARGATVFFSSHNLNEVRRICDRIGFIKDGKLINEQKIADLVNTAAHTFNVTFNEKAPIDKFQRLKSATVTGSPDPRHVTVRVQGELSTFFAILAHNKVSQIDQRDVDLEEEFMQLYGSAEDGDKP